jgi:dolichyl-phosphate-mannose-protein mannosyltransferase
MIGARDRPQLARLPSPSAVAAPVRPRRRSGRLRDPLGLAGVVAAVIGLNVWWRILELRPPHWDMGHHLANSLAYLNGFSFSHPLPFFDAFEYYPPLTYWITDVFYAALGNESMWVAILSNCVWLAILVFATYAIGKRLWNARVGWLSVVFVVTAPMMVTSFKEYMLDAPLTALSALALYLLIRADAFSSRRHSLLFGVACGSGLLVKWSLPLVLGLPVLHAAAGALARARLKRDVQPLLNLAGAAAATFAVAGLWYVHNWRLVAGSFKAYGGGGAVTGSPPVASLTSGLWYFWNLFDQQLYVVPTILLLVGLGFCVAKRGFASRNLYPLLSLVGTYALFTLLGHKDARYTLPLLPAAAVIGTSWIDSLRAKARNWSVGVFASYGAVVFAAISFGTSLLPRNLEISLPSTSFSPSSLVVFAQRGYLIGPPSHENWHQEDVFRTMAAFPRAKRSFAYAGPDTIWFNAHGLSYYAFRFDATRVTRRRAHFLIDRGGSTGATAGFRPLRHWRLPDGGDLGLYERAAV